MGYWILDDEYNRITCSICRHIEYSGKKLLYCPKCHSKNSERRTRVIKHFINYGERTT